MATFTGAKATFAVGGCTFNRNQPRPITVALWRQLQGHPWFVFGPEDAAHEEAGEDTPDTDGMTSEPVKRGRGRPRKVTADGEG